MTMMTEFSSSIRMQAHRANIERYRRLLAGRLTRIEREYIMRRIAEERAEMKCLEDDLPGDAPGGQRVTGSLLADRERRAATLRWEQRL
jgi:hypothetical protein